ncbi:MAG: SCO family protein [Acidiferrobacterales bacterium]
MNRRTFFSYSGTGATPTGAPHAGAAVGAADSTRRIAPKPTPWALTLPDIVLRTQNNKKVRLYEDLLKGKISLINMFYLRCTDGKCPLVTNNLAQVQTLLGKRLGSDTFMYSISLDHPTRDESKSLNAYSAHFSPRPGWLFLAAEKLDDMTRLQRALGYRDPENHIGVLTMGNEPLDRWACCPALSEPREIERVMSYLDWPKGWPKNRRQG